MDIKECHRVLELEIGASRIDIDNAYCRLLEQWHPDRVTPAGDPAAVREAARMVQAVNEAYQTLSKVAPPLSTKPAAAAPIAYKPAPDRPPAEPAAPRSKPALGALAATPGAVAPVRPTSAPPPRAAPLAPAPAATPPPAPVPPPAPISPPVLGNPATYGVPGTNTGQAAAGNGAPPPQSAASLPANLSALMPKPEAKEEETKEPFNLRATATALYDALFPPESPRRKYGLIFLGVAVLFVLLLGKCAFSSLTRGRGGPPDPKKTGIVAVKSNRPDTAADLTGLTASGKPTSAVFHGSGAAFNLSGLPPGKYLLVAKSEGWPEVEQDVDVEKAHTTEVAVHFKTGSLRLDSDPAGVTVRQGAEVLGKTPLVIPQLPPGECILSLEYPLFPPVTFKTTISENVEATGTVRLPYGKLTVESSPAGATVLLAGRMVGQTPLTLERVPTGAKKLTLQGKDFPPLEIAVTVEDRGEVKVSRELGSAFPELDPAVLLRAVWVPDDPNSIAPPFDSGGVYEPRNGVVKNLNRKRLYETWQRRTYRYSAIVKSYSRESGKVEFAEQPGELSKYRVLAELSAAARTDKDLAARLATKGVTLTVYGHLTAVEEPRWPGKVITFELSNAEPLH